MEQPHHVATVAVSRIFRDSHDTIVRDLLVAGKTTHRATQKKVGYSC